MPRDLFGDVTRPRTPVGSGKRYTVFLSLAAHVGVIVPLVLVPLLATDVLPMPRAHIFVTGEVVPPDPPPPKPPVRIDTKPRPNPNAAPLDAPTAITPEPVIDFDVMNSIESGVPGGLPGSDIIAGEPPPPPPPAPAPQHPLRLGGDIRAPQKIRDAAPVYPAMAQAARVQGTVILEAIIGVNGKVEQLRVLRSIPFLDQAALDAVRQWEYSPGLLNGVPVSVIMTVTVTFTLTR